MSIFWFITTLLLLHSCTTGVGVVNWKVSIPHSHPYMVYIRDTQTHLECGGFLVREDFVMTAASCKGIHLKVYLGVDDTDHLSEGIEVDIFQYKCFVNKPSDDIMLLKLKTPATLNETVNIIALPETNREEISSNCMVVGWGCHEYNKSIPSTVLREVNVTLLDSENCATPQTLCTQEEAGSIREGDFGCPLICGNVPEGIASYYKQKESTIYLKKYTKISHYLPWIHETMNAHKLWKAKLDEFNIADIRACLVLKVITP